MPGGVPDTDTFAMSDVVAEIGAGDDLIELFSLATGTFDPAYEGDKSNLLNFRNYAHTSPWNVPNLSIIQTTQYRVDFMPTANVRFSNDGLQFFVGGADPSDIRLNSYTLGAPWDITTITPGPTQSITTEPYGNPVISYSDTGEAMFMASPDGIYWAGVSAFTFPASFTDSSPLALNTNPVLGFVWNTTGTKFYTLNVSGILYEYNATTPFNVTSFTNSGNIFDFGPDTGGSIKDIAFKPDGLFLYASQASGVQEFSLGTAFDLSTMVYNGVKSGNPSLSGALDGIFVKPDGTRLFIIHDDFITSFDFVG